MNEIDDEIPLSAITSYLWEVGDLSYKLDDLQISIRNTVYEKIEAGEKKISIFSSRQIGKSFLVLCLAIELCKRYPGIIVRVLSSTLKQVADIVQDNMGPICADAPDGIIVPLRSQYRWRVGDSSLRLGALERAHVDSNRGGNASIVIFEEGGFVATEAYKYAVESVIGPQLLRSNGVEIHVTSPSEDEFHYIHEEIVPLCEIRGTHFCYTVYDSPSITPEMIEKAIERCGGAHTEAFMREYMAQIIRSLSLMVLPEFDEARHVKEFEIPEYYNPLVSIDGGGVRDKTAGLMILWDFERAKMLIWDEFCLDPNTDTVKIVESARKIEEGIDWRGEDPRRYGDMPGQTAIDLIKLYKYSIMLPLKDDRDAAISNLRTMMIRDQIEIHPRCKYLIGNCKKGRYNDNRTDFVRTDLFGHCDPLMALVYGARMVDRQTNPIPVAPINRDTQVYVPYRTEKKTDLDHVAREIAPYSPMKGRW